MNAENWRVYLILCENGALYCGISNRPQERFAAHLAGKGAKYTRQFFDGNFPFQRLAFGEVV